MRLALLLLHVTYFTLAIMTMSAFTVCGEPQLMTRPTRPKVFTSLEELRQYLDLVKDYYSLTGKARYGKRADPPPTQLTYDHPLNLMRIILALSRDNRRDQPERRGQTNNESNDKSPIMYPYEYNFLLLAE